MFILPLSFKSVLSLVLGAEDEERKTSKAWFLFSNYKCGCGIYVFLECTRGARKMHRMLVAQERGPEFDSLATL